MIFLTIGIFAVLQNQNEQQHETCESNQVQVRWHFVKDIPNVEFKHIRNPWNDNKPIPQSGDTQEVPFAQGSALLRVIAQYRAEYSIFDSLIDYESTEEDRKPYAFCRVDADILAFV
eukprot:m.549619 g.549619  ORF g.549619 m.549619 type:complete len:117 (+) comp22160_c0_seq26:2030-2380(+)